jgi:NADPH:quinone reductase-like Zn-dependent oxidoreductase
MDFRHLFRYDFASIGKAVVLLGIVTCFYQLYRRWKRMRAIKKLAGKVILITGASSGLGEGMNAEPYLT